MTELELTYANRTGRPPGRVWRTAARVVPGIARVGRQVEPYADAWHAHNREVLGRPGRRWIVLGDSMATGIGASSFDKGYVGQLARRLAATGDELNVVNLAATGARSSDVLAQQLPALELIGSRPDDVVTVIVGSNDILGGRAGRAALPRHVDELLERVPVGTVVATLTQPGVAALRANRSIERAAAAGRIVMLDLRVGGPKTWTGLLAADRFHPNDAGYSRIADMIEPTLRSVL